MSVYDYGFNRFLTKDSLFQPTVESSNSFSDGSSVQGLGSGSLGANVTVSDGFLQSEGFVSGSTGWKIDADGNLEANDGNFRGDLTGATGTFSGSLVAGSIHIPDEDTTNNSFHVESDGDSFWGCTQSDFTSDNDNANAYILKNGNAKFQNVTIDGGANVKFISDTIDTENKELLSDFDFGTDDYAGGVKAGDIAWSSDTGAVSSGSGVVVNRAGIFGAASGVETFSIDASDGSATFAGTLSAPDGTLGSITAGTITGATIQTASSGRRVKISDDQYVRWLNGDSTEGYIWNDGSGNFLVDADNILYLRADGSGDDVFIQAGDDIANDCGNFYVFCTGDNFISAEADNVYTDYNSDNDNSDCFWRNDAESNTRMTLNQDGDLSIDGDMTASGYNDFAEYFESLDGKEMPLGTSVMLEKGKIRPAKAGEQPIGVISAMAGFILGGGGSDCGTNWTGKYLRDEFGRFIEEETEWWTIHIEEKFEKETGQKGTKRKRISGYSDEKKPLKGAKIKTVKRRKLNPKYDKKREYIPRKDRPEWNVVGLIGRVRINKGQPINDNWIKLKDISDKVEEYLIK